MPERGGEYYDRLEVRDPAHRRDQLFVALPGLIQHAVDNTSGFASHLEGIDPATINTPDALAGLPILRKSELAGRQRTMRPFGGFNATPVRRLARLFASPGPIYDPESGRSDYWRFGRAMFAAGFRTGDLVHIAFSYHLTPAGSMAEGGARALGCPVIAAGTAQTERQIEVIADLGPAAFVGTPSFLKTLLERGRDQGADLSSLSKALVSAEPFPPALRDALADDFGIAGYQCYASADLGLIAYETPAREGLVCDEALIVEIVRPGTGDPVATGEVGEVVVTAFNPDYPLIRFATGDLSAMLPGVSPCGRTNNRLRGWMGRADQSAKVRGMFVHPGQVADIRRRHPELSGARLTVDHHQGGDRMVLLCEVDERPDGLQAAIVESARVVTGLRCTVDLVQPGSLPNDGKVIDDQREHA